MKVAVFGGTGFVGSYVVEKLVADGHEPSLLVRPESGAKVAVAEKCRVVTGEIGNAESVRATVDGCEAAIYLIGILREFRRKKITFEALHFEGAKRAVDAAREARVKRFLLLSANGAKPLGTSYQSTKYLAEEYLKASGVEWTIIRPSVIFGDPRGRMEFCTQLCDQVVRPRLPAPLFFGGLSLRRAGAFSLSPVFIGDVARVIAEAVVNPALTGRTLHLGGPKTHSWREILSTIAQAAGKKKWMVPVPAIGVCLVAAFLDRFPFFPITRDQIAMLLEGNSCDSTQLFADLGITPTPFTPEHLAYLVRR